MVKAKFLFVAGLIFYMARIYLSTIWIVSGAAIGILGGLMMGVSTYFSAMKR